MLVPRPETELLVDLARVARRPRGPGRGRPRHRVGRHRARGQAGGRPPGCMRSRLTDLAHAWAVRNRDRLGLDVAIDRGDARTHTQIS